jgi:hypothetical protein
VADERPGALLPPVHFVALAPTAGLDLVKVSSCAARDLGGLRAGADGRHLARQRDDNGIGVDINRLELRILGKAGHDGPSQYRYR